MKNCWMNLCYFFTLSFPYNFLFHFFQSGRLGNNCLGDVINGPPREKGDPYASDEDEALKALARSFEKKYVSRHIYEEFLKV